MRIRKKPASLVNTCLKICSSGSLHAEASSAASPANEDALKSAAATRACMNGYQLSAIGSELKQHREAAAVHANKN